MTLRVEPVKPKIGAVVHMDRSQIADPAIGRECRDLLEQYGVLVFPKIDLSDEEQLAFTDNLGERINLSKTVHPNSTAPDVYQVTLDPKINPEPEYVHGTFFWHMDGITTNAPPPKATILSARTVSEKGGQTEFASTYAAYDGLTDEEKDEFAQIRVAHSVPAAIREVISEATPEERARWAKAPVNEHPLVWTHETGRKSLIVGYTADKVVGQTVPEGRALLARLLEWTAQPDYTYRHTWSEGDLVVWDNTGALHRVIPYDKTSGRMMHRTSIAGTESVTA